MKHPPVSAALRPSLRPLRFSLLSLATALLTLLTLLTLLALPPAPLLGADPPKTGNPEPGTGNLLSNSKSPYLLQHADNPVNWHPWNDDAFALAKKEGKPVFLSIGYSTCHWCHVMEHESFEDPDTAAFLNKHFISIKVDREERPDIDRIYMNYQQAVHGSGGWPLSIWMSPDRIPFFTGTYFPKDPSIGQVTFMDMLTRIREAWEQHQDDIRKDSGRILERMDQIFNAPPKEADALGLNSDLIASAFERLSGTYDPQFGGFGSRPKFPQPVQLSFLLEHAASLGPNNTSADRTRQMVFVTLRKMAAGGIRDHIGGGFHRYSVDEFWHVPHFEKMLYDQAQIASIYLDAYQITRNPEFKNVALDTFAYVERLLSHPDGPFYSAEDADSLDPDGVHQKKTEGAFYVWSTDEIKALTTGDPKPEPEPEPAPDPKNKDKTDPPLELKPDTGADAEPEEKDAEKEKAHDEAARIFIAAYGMALGGNAPPGSDPFGEFKGKNILIRKKTNAELAAQFSKSEEEIISSLAATRALVLERRLTRPRPHLDDKILTAWNALMISAYTRAHEVLGEQRFLDRATAAANFLKENLYDPKTKTLLRSYRNGPSTIQGTADDYAFFIQALLDLHGASQETRWLEFALELQDRQLTLLLDEKNGGFFDSPATQTDLILRLKSSHDGARPSANSISALNLLRLSALIKSDRFDTALDGIFKSAAGGLISNPAGQTALLSALGRKINTPAQIVVVGKAGDPATTAILTQVRDRYLPNKVVLLLGDGPGRDFLNARNDLFAAFQPIDGKPTLYLCRNYACQRPTNDPKEIAAQLDGL